MLPGAAARKGSKKKTTTTRDVRGLDIYRLPHGTTIADARDPKKNYSKNGASYFHYKPGGPEYLITITLGDLGIAGYWES